MHLLPSQSTQPHTPLNFCCYAWGLAMRKTGCCHHAAKGSHGKLSLVLQGRKIRGYMSKGKHRVHTAPSHSSQNPFFFLFKAIPIFLPLPPIPNTQATGMDFLLTATADYQVLYPSLVCLKGKRSPVVIALVMERAEKWCNLPY